MTSNTDHPGDRDGVPPEETLPDGDEAPKYVDRWTLLRDLAVF